MKHEEIQKTLMQFTSWNPNNVLTIAFFGMISFNKADEAIIQCI